MAIDDIMNGFLKFLDDAFSKEYILYTLVILGGVGIFILYKLFFG